MPGRPQSKETENVSEVAHVNENQAQPKAPARNGARDEDSIGTEVLLEDIGRHVEQ